LDLISLFRICPQSWIGKKLQQTWGMSTTWVVNTSFLTIIFGATANIDDHFSASKSRSFAQMEQC
jgi:hypothetical protein